MFTLKKFLLVTLIGGSCLVFENSECFFSRSTNSVTVINTISVGGSPHCQCDNRQELSEDALKDADDRIAKEWVLLYIIKNVWHFKMEDNRSPEEMRQAANEIIKMCTTLSKDKHTHKERNLCRSLMNQLSQERAFSHHALNIAKRIERELEQESNKTTYV